MSDSFYLYLPSNASMRSYFPDNTVASYTVKLPRYLEFSDQWEVGLSEFHFPLTFGTVKRKSNDDEDEASTRTRAKREINATQWRTWKLWREGKIRSLPPRFPTEDAQHRHLVVW